MKKLLATLLTVTMLGSVSVPALAAEQPAEGEELSEEEEADNDALFNEYVEGLMESYNVKVTECPASLSYDPQTLAASAEAASANASAGAATEGDSSAAEGEDAKEE